MKRSAREWAGSWLQALAFVAVIVGLISVYAVWGWVPFGWLFAAIVALAIWEYRVAILSAIGGTVAVILIIALIAGAIVAIGALLGVGMHLVG